jgi:putative SbcD/Mre11-related phosphoesterase
MKKIEYIGKCLLIEIGEKEGKGRKRTLVIGDLHLGYEEALNRTGVFVSRGMFEEAIIYLEKVFEEVELVDEVVLLGDVKHDFGSILKQERNDAVKLVNWLLERAKRIIIVKGNHDNILEPILKGKAGVELVDRYTSDSVCFIHGDSDFEEIWIKEIKLVVMGHVHPSVRISDNVKSEKYKCFLVGDVRKGLNKKELIIVPSFSEHSRDLDVVNSGVDLPWKVNLGDFSVMVVSEDSLKVLNFGKLERLK